MSHEGGCFAPTDRLLKWCAPCGGSSPQQRRSHADDRRAFLDGHAVILRHAHGKLGEGAGQGGGAVDPVAKLARARTSYFRSALKPACSKW